METSVVYLYFCCAVPANWDPSINIFWSWVIWYQKTAFCLIAASARGKDVMCWDPSGFATDLRKSLGWWCDLMELDTEVKLMPPAIEAFMAGARWRNPRSFSPYIPSLSTFHHYMPPEIEAYMVKLCGAIPCHIHPSHPSLSTFQPGGRHFFHLGPFLYWHSVPNIGKAKGI